MTKIKPIAALLICCISFIAMASPDKVLQIFSNGTVIEEYNIADIDYIEINDITDTPADVKANVSDESITITWSEVAGATYNVYHSTDNVNYNLVAEGLTVTTYTDTNPCNGTNYYKIKAVVNDMESDFSSVVAGAWTNTSASGNGFYLGMNGFNNGLYSYPIIFLTNSSLEGCNNFIDGLTVLDGTRLYNAVGKSIDDLQAATFPDNLNNVAIVTFTDGLDRGSLDWTEDYMTLTEYLTALNSRLTGETVSDQLISAYSVGVCGADAQYNIASFRNNLQKLATSSNNVFEVDDMAGVNEAFMKIAELLSETKYIQTFKMKIFGLSHNEKLRFTFDNVSSHSSSKQYIEGTFNRKDRTLTDIKYVGMTSKSGSVVPGEFIEDSETGRKMYVFTFENLQSLDGSAIPVDKVQHWFTEEGYWNHDDEFTFDSGDIDIEKIKRSAAIVLNLDCSSSLGEEDFKALKESAKSFIKKLLDSAVDSKEVASVKLDKTAVTLAVGATTTLTATVLPVTALKKDVKWTSTNPDVASVDANGKVTAHKTGTATIVVTTDDGGFTATCQVSVVTLVTSLTLNQTSLDLYTGDNITLNATALPEDAHNKNITWKSSNPSVASVDAQGKITGLTTGSATITASTQDGSEISATCTVNVLQHVQSITLNHESVTLGIGSTKQLTPTISPANASNKQISWESSDELIATVNQNGVVTGIGKGTARITATSLDGEKTATCQVEVKQYVNGIKLDNTAASLTIGSTIQLNATVTPDDANDKSLTWTTSNSSVASVSQTGLVKGITSGTATITATSNDGTNIAARCTVTVSQPVKSISLSNSSLNLTLGSPGNLTVAFEPTNATNTNYTVTSSNTSVATVSKNGQTITVTPISLGTSTITVTSTDGSHKATCVVTVSLSTTPINLALAVKKSGVRYYIPYSSYNGSVPSGYTKEGITLSSGSTSFILALNDATTETKTYSDAITLGTLPSQTQAQVIVSNWSSLNTALQRYGGTVLSSSYWTRTSQGTRSAYSYSASGVGSVSSGRTLKVRCIIATL